MSQPRYQEVKAADIPLLEVDGAGVRVVAGSVAGQRGPVGEIAIDPVYIEVQLKPGASFTYPVPQHHTVLAYIFEGQGVFGDDPGEQVQSVAMLVFGAGDQVRVKAGDTGLRFMLMTGAPINEPIVPYGPFVMNTTEEIQQALADLRSGTFVT
jgi:redox-sensitive bicupin YhaK (pirin superfamily)